MWVCPMKQKGVCSYVYDACHDKTLFCRIIEDTPEHFMKLLEENKRD